MSCRVFFICLVCLFVFLVMRGLVGVCVCVCVCVCVWTLSNFCDPPRQCATTTPTRWSVWECHVCLGLAPFSLVCPVCPVCVVQARR